MIAFAILATAAASFNQRRAGNEPTGKVSFQDAVSFDRSTITTPIVHGKAYIQLSSAIPDLSPCYEYQAVPKVNSILDIDGCKSVCNGASATLCSTYCIKLGPIMPGSTCNGICRQNTTFVDCDLSAGYACNADKLTCSRSTTTTASPPSVQCIERPHLN